MKRQTPEEVRDQMRDLCLREYASMRGDDAAYVSALTSAAHLCDQISREATRQAMRHAARQCGDLIWSVADAVKAKRAADRETTSGGNVKNRIAYVAPTRTPAIDAAAGMEVTSADGLLNELRNANDGWAITIWNDGWKAWRTLDARYAEGDPGWLMTIDLADVVKWIVGGEQQ